MTKQEYQTICEDIGLAYDEEVYEHRDHEVSDNVLRFKFELVKRLKGKIGDYRLKLSRALIPDLYMGRDYPSPGEILIINFGPDFVEINNSRFKNDIEVVYDKIMELLNAS